MRFKALFLWLVIVAQIILYGHFWYGADKTTTDFPAFHATGLLWKSGEQPYDLENQCRVERQVNPDQPCLPFAHPPLLLPALALVSDSDYVASYWRWTALTTFILILCLIPLYFLSQDLRLATQSILFFPAIFGLWMGQDNSLVLLAVLMWAYLLKLNKDFLAGVVLSLGAVKPQLLLVLAIPLLCCRIKAFVGFGVGVSALVFLSLALVGFEGLKGILTLTALMSKIQGFGVWPEGMYNVTGILARSGINHFWSWPIFLLGIVFICVLWKRRNITPATISCGVIVSVFTAPHVHLWDLSLLIIALQIFHPLAPAVGSLLILSTFPFGLTYWTTYAMMLALLFIHLRNSDQHWHKPSELSAS